MGGGEKELESKSGSIREERCSLGLQQVTHGDMLQINDPTCIHFLNDSACVSIKASEINT